MYEVRIPDELEAMSIWSDFELWMGWNTSSYGILNLQAVHYQKVYRGGQPSRDGWKYLKSVGVKTVIKLNFPDEGLDDHPDFTVIDCAMPPKDIWQAVGKPDPVMVSSALHALTDQNNWPVFIHCLHGQDRTGLMVGMFRVKFDGWTKDEAYAEMMQFGFHPELVGLTEIWEQFS